MNFYEYLEDRVSFLLCSVLFLIVQSLLLYFLGNTLFIIFVLFFIWVIMFTCYLLWDFTHKYKKMKQIDNIIEQLDQKYLLYEVLPKNGTYEENYYKDLLYIGNKSMIEQVSAIRREREEYQEYIEQWVHEIKTPIAAMKLWSENQQVERKRDLQQQLERTENYVEQALYYARSENVAKDLHIHKLNISECIHDSIQKNKYLCLQSCVKIEVSNEAYMVFSDEKWMVFIMNQLIENAVKYRRNEAACITIDIQEEGKDILVSVKDNGKGICAQDLPRVFEKGFTGVNGRSANKHSTGIGLYLCERLCKALAVDIKIQSVVNEYTCVILRFKRESYNTVSAM